MKRAKLEELLRRKIRLKITNARRGKFYVQIQVKGSHESGCYVLGLHPNKRTALAFLHARLRIMPEISVEVAAVKGNGQ